MHGFIVLLRGCVICLGWGVLWLTWSVFSCGWVIWGLCWSVGVLLGCEIVGVGGLWGVCARLRGGMSVE